MKQKYDVFISCKNLSETGAPTRDLTLANEVYRVLSDLGLKVFFSKVSLEELGRTAYKQVIDSALESASLLVAIGTSRTYIESTWVRYEWDSFLSDILGGGKPNGQVFVYVDGITYSNLPYALRPLQCIQHGPDSLHHLSQFILNALGKTDTKQIEVENIPVDPGPSRTESTQQFHDLSGEWEGEWKPDTSGILHRGSWDGDWKHGTPGILHRGILSVKQEGMRLTASLRVSYEKHGKKSVVMESLRGVIASHCVALVGESFEFEGEGLPTSYLLDHFELQFDKLGEHLSGDFYCEKGRGWAEFKRIKKGPEEKFTIEI